MLAKHQQVQALLQVPLVPLIALALKMVPPYTPVLQQPLISPHQVQEYDIGVEMQSPSLVLAGM
jgi:hypothetical protein